MLDLEKELNDEQRAVVLNGDGPCLVLAGAGSGKTRTITYRVAHLLSKGVLPDEILLVTFTNKAAKEMISRVAELTNGAANLPWSGTFHHICNIILRKYAPVVGYKNNFTVLDSDDSAVLLKMCLKNEGFDRKDKRYPSAAIMRSIISYARNAEETIENVVSEDYSHWISQMDLILRISVNYERRKRDANAMDFDDLLVYARDVLKLSDEARKKYSEQFRYILVDEYQDANTLQASFVRILASRHLNILVVGDDAQSIYSFRAADIRHILSFEKTYENARIFRLETNYRSTPDILQVANRVIANNSSQYEKNLKSVLKSFARPIVRACSDEREEAKYVAERIQELIDEGLPSSQIAVLFRAAFHSQALEFELAKRNIQYDYRGGVRFFERAHIKDVLAYLRVFLNCDDAIAWMRALTLHEGIGPANAENIVVLIKERGKESISEIGSMLPSRAQVGWNAFCDIWDRLKRADEGSPEEAVDAVAHSAHYAAYLETEYPDARERREDIEQLSRFASQYYDTNHFLSEAVLQEGHVAGHISNENAGKERDRIVLSTIHQAKGLEWEAVFLLRLAAGQFPSDRSSRDAKGLEEERRLFYVGITRAKKHLYFTYPVVSGFDALFGGPSQFLSELEEPRLLKKENYEDDEISYISEDEPEPLNKPKVREFLKSIDRL